MRLVTPAEARMVESPPDDLLVLLCNVPLGEYLVEQDDSRRMRVLWRLSPGEPPDGALDPAPAWALSTGAWREPDQPSPITAPRSTQTPRDQDAAPGTFAARAKHLVGVLHLLGAPDY
jgi:hypothetical protein